MSTTATTAASAATGAGSVLGAATRNVGGKMGKDEFLKLLVAQMKNQDPDNPMDGQQLSAHLAQFSQLEQLINLNDKLEMQAAGQSALASAVGGSVAMSALGKHVVARGDQVAVAGREAAPLTVDVGAEGGVATLKLYDAAGRQVGSREIGPLAGGRQTVEVGAAARNLPDGTYRYAVEVVTPAGDPVPVQPYVTGRVSGVQYGPDGPTLVVGGIKVTLGSVTEMKTE